jgi:hypothetical protein
VRRSLHLRQAAENLGDEKSALRLVVAVRVRPSLAFCPAQQLVLDGDQGVELSDLQDPSNVLLRRPDGDRTSAIDAGSAGLDEHRQPGGVHEGGLGEVDDELRADCNRLLYLAMQGGGCGHVDLTVDFENYNTLVTDNVNTKVN